MDSHNINYSIYLQINKQLAISMMNVTERDLHKIFFHAKDINYGNAVSEETFMLQAHL